MKKTFLVVAIVMCTLLHAQDEKLSFGIKAGINFANLKGDGLNLYSEDGPSSFDSKLGITVGGFLEYKLSEKFAIQPELLYSQQGTKKEFPNSQSEIELRLNYINVPFMVKYYAIDGLSLEVGPQVNFLTNSEFYRKSTAGENEVDMKDYFKSTDFGLNIGAGYQLENGLGINVRYTLGLTDIFDYSFRDSKRSTKINKYDRRELTLKNRVFTIALSYVF